MTLTERRELVQALKANLEAIRDMAYKAAVENPNTLFVTLEHRIGRALIDFELLTTATVDELGECAAVSEKARINAVIYQAPAGFYILRDGSLGASDFLHSDGVWRDTTFNADSGKYTGYYERWADAFDALKRTQSAVLNEAKSHDGHLGATE